MKSWMKRNIAFLVELFGSEGDINVPNDIEAALRGEYPAIHRSRRNLQEVLQKARRDQAGIVQANLLHLVDYQS